MGKATRAALGETLIELADSGLDVMAVDADLAGSTTTAKFGAVYPQRLVEVGVAEQNMVAVAAGLSLAGKVVFTGSFAVFGTGRAYDQIRNTVCYNDLNVKLAPTHAGVTVGPDGGSHQMLEDIALMRVLPRMRVLVPADWRAAKAALRLAAETPGPFYIRLGRVEAPKIYGADERFEAGGAKVLRPGSDVTLVACGVEVNAALEAAHALSEQGVSAEVIDAFSIKPLDVATILESAAKTKAVVTCEEHNIIGGLGSAVAEALSEGQPCRLARVGVKDCFGQSGSPDELLRYFELDGPAIVKAALCVQTVS
ncbi:MAG: transketolase family protein [Coriobacteriia bacterium]|nr:transketolase family protein [Coriobacteriia bacterium]